MSVQKMYRREEVLVKIVGNHFLNMLKKLFGLVIKRFRWENKQKGLGAVNSRERRSGGERP
jgi:hypothetical protein